MNAEDEGMIGCGHDSRPFWPGCHAPLWPVGRYERLSWILVLHSSFQLIEAVTSAARCAGWNADVIFLPTKDTDMQPFAVDDSKELAALTTTPLCSTVA